MVLYFIRLSYGNFSCMKSQKVFPDSGFSVLEYLHLFFLRRKKGQTLNLFIKRVQRSTCMYLNLFLHILKISSLTITTLSTLKPSVTMFYFSNLYWHWLPEFSNTFWIIYNILIMLDFRTYNYLFVFKLSILLKQPIIKWFPSMVKGIFIRDNKVQLNKYLWKCWTCLA